MVKNGSECRVTLCFFCDLHADSLVWHFPYCLLVAPVYAAVETICGAAAGLHYSGCHPSSDLGSRIMCSCPACCIQQDKPTQHRRVFPRLRLPVNKWSAGSAGGQLPEQRDSRLSEDGTSTEPCSYWWRGQRRLQPVGAVPLLCAAEGGGGWGGDQWQNRNAATLLTTITQQNSTVQLPPAEGSKQPITSAKNGGNHSWPCLSI